jgi:hypothetical protein
MEALELTNEAGVLPDRHRTSDVETVDGRVHLTDTLGRAEWRGREVEESGHEPWYRTYVRLDKARSTGMISALVGVPL